MSHFLTYSNLDTWLVVEVAQSSHIDNNGSSSSSGVGGGGDGESTEYLLVFQTLAIYVDQQGRKTRSNEIMYPAMPTFITHENEFLLVFSETHVDVFNIESGEWVQSIGLKKARPLCNNGTLSLTMMNESPYVVYLSNMMQSKLNLYLSNSII
jgi:serine/threonine-protein kinase MRCK